MTDRETIARIIGEHIAYQLKTVAIVDGRVKADLKVLPIADAILAEGMDNHGLSIRIEQRPDGGIRVWSPQVKGLILSGSDPVKVMADVWPAIQAIVAHREKRPPPSPAGTPDA